MGAPPCRWSIFTSRRILLPDNSHRRIFSWERGNVCGKLGRGYERDYTVWHYAPPNGPEFIAKRLRWWLKRHKINTLFIEPGSPWENGYIESFNGKLRDELLKREVFDTLFEAQVLIERWRQEYNTVRPHSSLGYRPPAPETIQPRWLNQQTLSHKLWYN